ncbi:GM25400 [Drosophila sechellia]|uniref:GM25400 n=1 Tax=Drosophila sechellia TaxID=7238 RepID=B4IEP6_DROSE|nr:GM25400 [Drosophila sechellia]
MEYMSGPSLLAASADDDDPVPGFVNTPPTSSYSTSFSSWFSSWFWCPDERQQLP